jgi:hypothetical protein
MMNGLVLHWLLPLLLMLVLTLLASTLTIGLVPLMHCYKRQLIKADVKCVVMVGEIGLKCAMAVRGACITLVFQKSLRMNLAERRAYSPGDIVNIVSVDADNIMNFCWSGVHDVSTCTYGISLMSLHYGVSHLMIDVVLDSTIIIIGCIGIINIFIGI